MQLADCTLKLDYLVQNEGLDKLRADLEVGFQLEEDLDDLLAGVYNGLDTKNHTVLANWDSVEENVEAVETI